MKAKPSKVKCSRVVHVLPSGKLVLDCGHTVVRVARKSFVLCDKCNPEEYAARVERLKNVGAAKVEPAKVRFVNIEWTVSR